MEAVESVHRTQRMKRKREIQKRKMIVSLPAFCERDWFIFVLFFFYKYRLRREFFFILVRFRPGTFKKHIMDTKRLIWTGGWRRTMRPHNPTTCATDCVLEEFFCGGEEEEEGWKLTNEWFPAPILLSLFLFFEKGRTWRQGLCYANRK